MPATTEPLTAEAFFALDAEDERFMELVGGVVVVNDPVLRHQGIVAVVLTALRIWTTAATGRGQAYPSANVPITDHDVYKPDVLWIAQANLPDDLRKRLAQVPDLCVEVRSPSTWRFDIGRKKAMYEATGLRELWLVDDLAETVIVYRRSAPGASSFDVALELGGDEALTSPQLPGFSIPVRRLFAG